VLIPLAIVDDVHCPIDVAARLNCTNSEIGNARIMIDPITTIDIAIAHITDPSVPITDEACPLPLLLYINYFSVEDVVAIL
jgi:hypothetical protein